MARARKRALAGGCEGRDVRDRAAARERPGRGREPDELADPAHGLVLDLGRGARPDREVDVEARCEQVADDADLEPRRADEREEPRPGLRDRHVEDARRVVEGRQGARPVSGERGPEERLEAVVDPGLAGARLVEAPPRVRDDRRGVAQRLVAGRVEAERRDVGGRAHRPAESSAGRRRHPATSVRASRSRLGSSTTRAATGSAVGVAADVHPALVGPLGRSVGPADLRERVRSDVRPPVRETVELAVDAGDRVRRPLAGADRHVPVREAHRAEAGMRHDDQVADGVHPLVAGNAERGVDRERERELRVLEPGRREQGSSRRREDEVGRELAEIATDRHELGLPPKLGDRDAAVEARARRRERVRAEGGQRLVEAVERAGENVEHGDVVTGRRECRRRLRPDQAGADDDDPLRARGERRRDGPEARRIGVHVGELDPRDRRTAVAQPRREHDGVGLDLRVVVDLQAPRCRGRPRRRGRRAARCPARPAVPRRRGAPARLSRAPTSSAAAGRPGARAR